MLFELLPLAAFVVAYKFYGGIYVATTVLMVGMVLSTGLLWLRARKLPAMFAASTALVLLFGAATLLLRDIRFLQWKPTIFLWLLALAFLASAFIGRQPLVQRFMQPVLGESQLPRADWLKLNTAWVLYGLIIGAVNLYVVYNAAESTWVSLKAWGLPGTMFLFLIGQFTWLQMSGRLKA